MMQDDRLRRFHAGHDMVKFFYGAVRQIPEKILDAILDAGISVTLVGERPLLAYRDVRSHQSLHTGRTRRTIYMPEQVLEQSFNRGYDYWALSEVIIQEAWPLLDYILILELARRVQVKMRQVNLPGVSFIKDTLRELNKHLNDPSARLRDEGRYDVDPKDDEFMLFYGTYSSYFYGWDRSILEVDPYDLADEIFDEGLERQWAAWKADNITHTYNYPTYFQLDRDIVHSAAYELAGKYGQPLAPTTVEEVLHDLGDVARFRVGRQVKTEPLLDQLIDFGAPGILALAEACARERITRKATLTADYFDGYEILPRFRQKLQDWSSDLPPDLGVGRILDRLGDHLAMSSIRAELESFRQLPVTVQAEWCMHMRETVFQLIGVFGPRLNDVEKDQMLATPNYYTPAQRVQTWFGVAEKFLPEDEADERSQYLVQILRELGRHPQFHSLFLEQVRQLSATPDLDFGANQRDQVAQLADMIPDQAYRFSSDPQALNRRIDEFRRLLTDDPDSGELLVLAAAIFLRLDDAPNYTELVSTVAGFGPSVRPALEQIVEAIAPRDERRTVIRQVAERLLQSS